MASFKSPLLTRRLLLAVTVLVTALLAVPNKASAEIILDDFDEPFEITLPEMNGDFVSQIAVGELDAERRSRVTASSGSQPVGGVDASLTTPSALTFSINRLNPHPVGGLPVVALSLPYYFQETDVTQGGLNDRVIIDFDFLRSARSLARIDVFVQDASQPGITYVSQLFDISTENESFHLQFPFDSFRIRGGGAGQVDFERVYWTLISIYPVYFSGPDEIRFSTAVERIRFTGSVPEPSAGFLACFVAVVLNRFHRRRTE